MTLMDKFTEEISHFIGFFHISVENARAREAYTEFAFAKVEGQVDELTVHSSDFAAPFDLLGFEPGFGYRAPPPDHWYVPVKMVAPEVTIAARSVGYSIVDNAIPNDIRDATSAAMGIVRYVSPEIDAPGSVINHFSQAISLSDDDYFSVGGHGLAFNPQAVDNAAVLDGFDQASALSPLGEFERAGSSEDVIAVIKSIIDQLDAAPADDEAVQIHIKANAIEGVYVNGELVEEAPKLEDYRSFGEEESAKDTDGEGESADETEQTSTSNIWIRDDGAVAIEVSVDVGTGGNAQINNAVMQNFWTGATVTLVSQDHIEVDAIIQINAIWDTDAITSAIANWTEDTAGNELFNIATFDHLDTSAGNEPAPDASEGYPAFWAVTEIKGDLMIVNWLEQIVFMSDDDVGILSSSGVTTSVVAGDNFAINHASVFELGFMYDLIIIGGSVYDANIIHQINVLFDNDTIGAMADFETSGEGSYSSSGNLLWNEARIGTVGDADRFDDLTEAQKDTLASFASGEGEIAAEVLSDNAFAGLEGLRVLYISGDLINLQYIRQTNILGDSDQIALAMDAIAPNLDADWTIETGSNALVNNAVIVDLDSVGKTYIGGQQYSEATLFQAELISSHPDFGGPHPDALVSEAVLFLDDSMLNQDDDPAAFDASCMPSEYDGQASDGVNSIIGH